MIFETREFFSGRVLSREVLWKHAISAQDKGSNPYKLIVKSYEKNFYFGSLVVIVIAHKLPPILSYVKFDEQVMLVLKSYKLSKISYQ
jgi:hypothetical protein